MSAPNNAHSPTESAPIGVDPASQTAVIEGVPYPQKAGSFVAYQAEPWVGSDPSGERVNMRTETFVRMYRSIGVAGVKETQSTGRGGEPFVTLQVTFSAASADIPGLQIDFGANTRADSKIAEVIRWAGQSPERRLAVILETRRKPKDKRGEEIPRQVGILALRSGKSLRDTAAANPTGDTCVNILAGVGRIEPDGTIVTTMWSGEAVSDPAEFAELARNQRGEIPPTGWRHVTDNDKVSYIVPSASGVTAAAPTGGQHANIDVNAMGDLVNAAVASAVAEAGAALGAALDESLSAKLDNVLLRLGVPAGTPETRQGSVDDLPPGIRSRARARESRPWEPRNADGRVNPNGYLVKQEQYALEIALGLFAGAREAESGALPPEDQWDSRIRGVQQLLLWMAGKVQEGVVGAENRLAESHSSSMSWIRTVTDYYLPLPAAALSDQSESRSWSEQVIAQATALYRQSMVDVGKYLNVDPDLPSD